MPETTMKMPALAVVGPDHRIILSTESFRRRYEDAESIFERSPEIEKVLTGRADVATVTVGDLSARVEAVTDASGCRQAMLTLPPVDATATSGPPVSAVCDAAEESPAIVWVKDLQGRYLYANPRYASDYDTSPERLRGSTDVDLPERETVDGPRLRYAKDGLEEPLQLEYTVPAFDRRPAMAVFRFPLHDDSGQAIATCGVAAPTAEAQVARDEAVRLMQLERWNRLDPDDVRAEVLEQWQVQTAPPRQAEEAGQEPPSEGPDAGEPIEQTSRPSESTAAPAPALSPAEAQAPTAPSLSETAELLQTNLQLARKWADRAEQLQAELRDSQERIRQAESEAQQAAAAAAGAAEEAERWRSELEQARIECAEAQAEAHAARSEAEAARGELGAARAHADALRGPSATVLRLSEELGHVVATGRERSDELERTLARLRARLTDLQIVFESTPPAATRST